MSRKGNRGKGGGGGGGFGGGAPNMQALMKQAQKMQDDAQKVQEEMADKTVEVSAGGEMIKLTMNGKQEIVELSISSEIMEENDVEMLQDLIITAVNDASQKSKAMSEEAMSQVTGGMGGIPGL